MHLHLLFAAFLGLVGSASAAGVVWPKANGGNGHRYEVVFFREFDPPFGTWDRAKKLAEERGGYLATITSAKEEAFVVKMIKRPEYWNHFLSGFGDYFWDGPWIGGFQVKGGVEPAGGWKWVTGEPFDYTAWHRAEPDDLFGGQDEQSRLHFWDRRKGENFANVEPAWDDAAPDVSWLPAFVVEYGPESSVATIAIRKSSSRRGFLTVRGRAWSPAGIRSIFVTINRHRASCLGSVNWTARRKLPKPGRYRLVATIVDSRGRKARDIQTIVIP